MSIVFTNSKQAIEEKLAAVQKRVPGLQKNTPKISEEERVVVERATGAIDDLDPLKKILQKILAEPVKPERHPTKEVITIRLDREIVDYFRDQGPGYQSRINTILGLIVNTMKTTFEQGEKLLISDRGSIVRSDDINEGIIPHSTESERVQKLRARMAAKYKRS